MRGNTDAFGSWTEFLRSHVTEPEALPIPEHGLARDIGDLIVRSHEIRALSERVSRAFEGYPRVRELVVQLSHEASVMTAFAVRAARAAKIPTPGAMELAAVAIWVGAEREARSLEEKERRMDKFRKRLEVLQQTEAALDELAALR